MVAAEISITERKLLSLSVKPQCRDPMGVDSENLVGCRSWVIQNIQDDSCRLRQRKMAILIYRLGKFHQQNGLTAFFADDQFFDAEVWRARW